MRVPIPTLARSRLVRAALGLGFAALGAVALGAVGCTAAPPSGDRVSAIKATIATCDNAADCDRMWLAARDWITQNACCLPLVASDDVLETGPQPARSRRIGFRVTREPLSEGVFRFVPHAWCNRRSCERDVFDAMVDFNFHVDLAKAVPSFPILRRPRPTPRPPPQPPLSPARALGLAST